MEYIEIVEGRKHCLVNLENVVFIDASQIEEVPKEYVKKAYQNETLYQGYIIIPSSLVSIKIPVYGNTIEEAYQKQMDIYNKLFSCISAKQKKVKEIKI